MTEAPFFALVDLFGTLAFAISGGLLAVQRRMDGFGVLVLAFVTAVFGGIVRDLVIGAAPPEAFRNWHDLGIATAAALLCFFGARWLDRFAYPVQLFDAAGLGLFAVGGTQKALQFGIDPVMAGTLGVVTGIGGGMLRDVLAQRQPIVLSGPVYALAAIAAIVLVLAGHAVGLQITTIALPAIALCFVLRVLAIYRNWRLPPAPEGPNARE